MRALGTLVALLVLPAVNGTLIAQDRPPARSGPGTVVGVVVAKDTGEPLPSTVVQVWSTTDTSVVEQTWTNAEGRFRIRLSMEGDFFVRLVHVGYSAMRTERFALAEGAMRNLGTLRLPLAVMVLEPIEVLAERPAVTYEADRTAYDVSRMPMAEGASVTEAFQHVPELDVDIDGRVTLRGDAVSIYINGRPALMSAEALAIHLEQLPAGYLERIEVLDNPSVRYGAARRGGIVNLVTKEGVELGPSGSVHANAGTRGQFGGGVHGAIRRGDWSFEGGGTLRVRNSETTGYNLRRNLRADPAFLRRDYRSDPSALTGGLRLAAGYEVTERARIFARGHVSRSGSESSSVATTTHMDDDEVPILAYDRTSATDSRNLSGNLSTGFEYRWEPRRHTLQIDLSLRSGTRVRGGRAEIAGDADLEDAGASMPAELTLTDESELQQALSLSVDYARPWGGSGGIEIGFRSGQEYQDEDRVMQRIDERAEAPDPERVDRSFAQTQISNALYTTLEYPLGSLDIHMGLRAERLGLRFETATGESVRREYIDLFPSTNLSYRFDRGLHWRLSYARKVGRPSASVLDPTDRSTDPLNRRIGNPDIEPNYTHSVVLKTTWSGSKGQLHFSSFYRKTTNDWTTITTVDDQGISTSTYQNLASRDSYGALLRYAVRSRGGWGGNLSIGGQRHFRDASNLATRYSGSSFRWAARAGVRARVFDALSAEGTFSYSAPVDLPQGRQSDGRYTADMRLRYRFLDNRASIRLSLRDPFGLRQSSSRMQDLNYIQIASSRESTRSAEINVSYALGGARMRAGRGS